MKISNKYGEGLDFVIEGKADAYTTVIFVHGFGTNRDEGSNLFVDIADGLKNDYRLVRFDFSGCGSSGGSQQEASLRKHEKDLGSMIEYVKRRHVGKICIIAHSMGTFVTMALAPAGIAKTVFISMPDSDTSRLVDAMRKRIESRKGGVFNEKGISAYPRSSGAVQEVGPSFWREMRAFDPAGSLKKYADNTNLIAFRPLHDEIVEAAGQEVYQDALGMRFVEIEGDHDFKKQEDRTRLIERIGRFLSST